MGFGNFGRRAGAIIIGSAAPSARSATVGAAATGTLYTISRMLGSSSTVALIAGTNSNLTLSGLNVQATAAIGAGGSQVAVVREVSGQIAVEYPVTLTGGVTVPAAPTLSLTTGNTQATLTWTDGATGGSAITAHKIYRSTVAGFTPGPTNLLTTITSASPYVDTGLTNGTTYYYAISAVNGVAGEGATSAVQSVTPSIGGTYIPSTGLTAAWGMAKLVSGYSGPLFKLRRSTDNATLDISAASGSQLPDYTAISAWAGAANLFVTTIYDQSGGAANLVQATAASQPALDLAQMNANGCYPALFDGLQVINKMQAALATDRQNMSVIQALDMATVGGSQSTFETNDGTNCIQALCGSGAWFLYSQAGGQTFPAPSVTPRSQLSAIGLTCSATERRIFYRETSVAVAAAAAGNGTNYQIGTVSGTSFKSAQRFYGHAVYSAQTTASMNTALGLLRTIFAIPTVFDRRVIFVGDSITAGQFATRLKNLQAQLSLNGTPEVFNIGASGQTLASALGIKTTTTDVLMAGAPYSGRTLLVIQGGINDLRAGTAGSTLYATATSFSNSAHTAGCKSIIADCLPDAEASWTGAMETQRLNYQTQAKANSAGADGVLDLANTATVMGALTAPNDVTLYADKLHPTTLGYSNLAPEYSAAINTLLP